jgi:hypothetical protein
MLTSMLATAEAGWLIYHEPEIKGTIRDIETKQPIEGAVVVAVYKKATMGVGAGSISSVINVKETLTDKDGNFHLSSYTTFIQPFSWQIPTMFIIFKPGYASLELGLKDYFTGVVSKELKGSYSWNSELQHRVFGPDVVELPKAKTREERWKANMVDTGPGFRDKTPLLNRLIEEENKALGVR